jgi:hypothetical protein
MVHRQSQLTKFKVRAGLWGKKVKDSALRTTQTLGQLCDKGSNLLIVPHLHRDACWFQAPAAYTPVASEVDFSTQLLECNSTHFSGSQGRAWRAPWAVKGHRAVAEGGGVSGKSSHVSKSLTQHVQVLSQKSGLRLRACHSLSGLKV